MSSKVAFITGCSSGLGFAAVKKFIECGYTVYATMRNLSRKGKLQEACNYSDNLHILEVDQTNDEQIQAAVTHVLSRHSHVNVLIHNAAVGLIGPVDSATSEEMRHLFEVNVFSIVKLTQLLLPSMRKNRDGHILFIGSISGIESAAYQGLYASTKFALEAIASSWATTLPKWNIKVTILEPGAMNTELPHKISQGSYYSHTEDPYFQFNKNALAFVKDILKNGVAPDEVADILVDIVKTDKPVLRYQTCSFSKELVHRHLKDPDGVKWIEEHRQFIEQFY